MPSDEKHQTDQQDRADTKQEECKPPPQADVILHPLDIFCVVGLQLGNLGNVLSFGLSQLLLELEQLEFLLQSILD